ncbi:hypothetical protein [Azospirillum sp. INR13]|uniref:hypothetical protein n=1 Tax=Azospirillum sp. INR13 TaxID=2596919 RepID=UPI0018920C1A|nr:hypothetical protein [Azospirillum sp. INR13]
MRDSCIGRTMSAIQAGMPVVSAIRRMQVPMVSRLAPNWRSKKAHMLKWLAVSGLIGGPSGMYSSSAFATALA